MRADRKMETTFEWKPEPTLLDKIVDLANQRGQSPEAIIEKAVVAYIQSQLLQTKAPPSRGASLIELMRGRATAHLSTDEIMQLTRHIDD